MPYCKLSSARFIDRLYSKVYFTVSRDMKLGTFAMTPDQLDNAGYVNQRGLSRKHIFESVDHSLKRLGLDYIDLLQCHRFDYDTPIEETMQALHDVVKSGKVRYIGMSSCYAWQCALSGSFPVRMLS